MNSVSTRRTSLFCLLLLGVLGAGCGNSGPELLGSDNGEPNADNGNNGDQNGEPNSSNENGASNIGNPNNGSSTENSGNSANNGEPGTNGASETNNSTTNGSSQSNNSSTNGSGTNSSTNGSSTNSSGTNGSGTNSSTNGSSTNNSATNGNTNSGASSSMSVSGTFHNQNQAHPINIVGSCPNWAGSYAPSGDDIFVTCADGSADMYGVHLAIKRPEAGATLTEPTFAGDDMLGHFDVGSYNDPNGDFGAPSCLFVTDCMATSNDLISDGPSMFVLTVDSWDSQSHELSGSAGATWPSRNDGGPWAENISFTFDLNFDCSGNPTSCPLVK